MRYAKIVAAISKHPRPLALQERHQSGDCEVQEDISTHAPLLSASAAALAMSVIRDSSTHAPAGTAFSDAAAPVAAAAAAAADCCFSSATYGVGDTKCANAAAATTTTNKTAYKCSADNDWPKATRTKLRGMKRRAKRFIPTGLEKV